MNCIQMDECEILLMASNDTFLCCTRLVHVSHTVFQNWAFSDIRVGRVLTKVKDSSSQHGKNVPQTL